MGCSSGSVSFTKLTPPSPLYFSSPVERLRSVGFHGRFSVVDAGNSFEYTYRRSALLGYLSGNLSLSVCRRRWHCLRPVTLSVVSLRRGAKKEGWRYDRVTMTVLPPCAHSRFLSEVRFRGHCLTQEKKEKSLSHPSLLSRN